MTDKREQDAMEITERDKADFRQMVSEEPGLSGDPVWNVGYRLIAERRAALTRPASGDAVEAKARAIYEHWAFGTWEKGDKPAWVEGGNSTMQDLARQFARATLTTEAPAQTEAMALASIREFVAGCTCQSDRDAILTHVTTLRQPASVEAEPVAWEYEQKDRIKPIKLLTNQRWDEEERECWTETPLYAHPSADVTALLGDVRRWYGRCESETGCDYLNGEAGHGDAWDDMKAICSRIDAHLADQVQS